MVIPGTLYYVFPLAAAHADQLGDQVGSGGCGKETEKVGVLRFAFITIGGLEVAEPVVSVGVFIAMKQCQESDILNE